MSWINKKASHNYIFLETYTCGIILSGKETRSFFDGGISFGDSYCYFKDSELFLKNFHIAKPKNIKETLYETWQPIHDRKLLLKKNELKKLKFSLQKGLTIVPIKAFIKDKKYIKIEIALSKGKKTWDKREDNKKKEDIKKIKQYA